MFCALAQTGRVFDVYHHPGNVHDSHGAKAFLLDCIKVPGFHHGRGYQEKILGEMTSQGQMEYIAVRCLCGNQLYLMASMLAHNLTQELQRVTRPQSRRTTEKRSALWVSEELGTLRHQLLQRAGKLPPPHGILTLAMTPNTAVKEGLTPFLKSLKKLLEFYNYRFSDFLCNAKVYFFQDLYVH